MSDTATLDVATMASLKAHFVAEAQTISARLEEDNYETPEAKAADVTALEAAVAEAKSYDEKIQESKGVEDQISASKKTLEALSILPHGKPGEVKPDAKGTDPEEPFSTVTLAEAKEILGLSTKVETKTPGQLFAESEGLAEVKANNFSDNAITHSKGAQVELKALLAAPAAEVSNRYESYAPTPMALHQAVTYQSTELDSIKVQRLVYSTNAAAVTAVGTAAPESTLAWEGDTLTPEDMVHWTPVDKYSLEDNGVVRATVDVELADGVRDKTETHIITKVDAITGLGTQAFSTDVPETIRKARTAAELVSAPVGVVMNPSDVEAIDLLQDTTNRYLGQGPFGGVVRVIWGLLVVSTSAVTAGWAYVGDPRRIVVYERDPVTISTGWQNDDFAKRQVSVMANTRIMVDLFRPAAMIKADLTA